MLGEDGDRLRTVIEIKNAGAVKWPSNYINIIVGKWSQDVAKTPKDSHVDLLTAGQGCA